MHCKQQVVGWTLSVRSQVSRMSRIFFCCLYMQNKKWNGWSQHLPPAPFHYTALMPCTPPRSEHLPQTRNLTVVFFFFFLFLNWTTEIDNFLYVKRASEMVNTNCIIVNVASDNRELSLLHYAVISSTVENLLVIYREYVSKQNTCVRRLQLRQLFPNTCITCQLLESETEPLTCNCYWEHFRTFV